MQQKVYNQLVLNRIPEAILIVEDFRRNHKFDRKGGFFMRLEGADLMERLVKIRKSTVLSKMGVPKEYESAITSIICMHYFFYDFNRDEKIIELYPEIINVLQKSKKIKNKDLPFVDLMNLIQEYPVYKL